MRHVRLGIGSASLMTFVTVSAVGLLAGPEATLASASAAAATPTQIVFAASPSVVSYPSPQITVSGVLETTGSPPQPLEKTMVSLSFAQGADTAGYGVLTDATGHFRLTIT